MNDVSLTADDYFSYLITWWKDQEEFPRQLKIRIYDYLTENDEVHVEVWPHEDFHITHTISIGKSSTGPDSNIIQRIPICIIKERVTSVIIHRLAIALKILRRWYGLEYKEGIVTRTVSYGVSSDRPHATLGSAKH